MCCATILNVRLLSILREKMKFAKKIVPNWAFPGNTTRITHSTKVKTIDGDAYIFIENESGSDSYGGYIQPYFIVF
jgi:hypothetical protein